MTRRSRIALGVSVAIVAALFWYFLAERRVPEGQPPLATLSAGTLDSLRADFNRDAGATRIIVLLSPT